MVRQQFDVSRAQDKGENGEDEAVDDTDHCEDEGPANATLAEGVRVRVCTAHLAHHCRVPANGKDKHTHEHTDGYEVQRILQNCISKWKLKNVFLSLCKQF